MISRIREKRRLFPIVQNILQEKPTFSYVLLFFFAFSYFFFLQNQPTFADPDSFYHARISALMLERGLKLDFPWFQYTVLKTHFADHHLLYHMLLIPFVAVLPPLLGLKLATILFSSLTVTLIYWFLRKNRVKASVLFVFILMMSGSFIFRLNLAKAQSLALSIFFISFFCIHKKNVRSLFVVSLIYVWLYGGWPLIFVLLIISGVSEIFVPFIAGREKIKKFKRVAGEVISQYAKLSAAAVTGVLLGIIVNPYFPNNLFFYWHQIVNIAIVNYKDIIGVGGEWYRYGPIELIASSSIAFILLVVGLTFFFLTLKKQDALSLSLFFLTVFFYILTLKSRRNVEYLIPVMVTFSAVALTRAFRGISFRRFSSEVFQFFQEQKILFAAALIPLLIFPYIVVRDYLMVRKAYAEGQSFDKFREPMEWLKANSPPGSIVFHSDWDEAPILFYHNTQNYYIVGLDPTFMYQYDQDLYWKWKNVTLGEEKYFVYSIIKNDFRADYVFVSTSRHGAFDAVLRENFLFEKVYESSDAKIYKVL